ncbi:hypothetical protein D3C71_1490230 [compost metagenome]
MGTDCALDDIGVNLDAAVTEKAFQRLSAGHCIADRLRGLGLARDLRQLLFPDVKKVGDNGRRPLLSCGSTDVGILSPDLVLDLPQLAHRLHRGCRGVIDTTDMQFVEFAPDMRPAPCQRDGFVAACLDLLFDHARIGAVPINLENAVEAAQVTGHTAPTSAVFKSIGDHWWP